MKFLAGIVIAVKPNWSIVKSKIFLISGLILSGCVAPQLPDMIDVPVELPKVQIQEKKVLLPSKALPAGWSFNHEVLADWGASLPEVLGILPDTAAKAEYWNEPITLETGIKFPLKRAKITYKQNSRLTEEFVELHFVNVDHIYSVTNHESSHYELSEILKSVQLKDTGFPQLVADDVLKHKVLEVYGTPKDFDGTWHRYEDKNSQYSVRVVDDKNMAIQLKSVLMERKRKQAFLDVYSAEGIDQKKLQLMEGFDL